ncbi:MAG: outer membrane lipid asymmetry maintenance protein MlaD [Parvibaculales bacterium]
MKENFIETLVGAVVIVVAIGFVIYGYSVTESDTRDGYIISAQFDRVDGLTIGSDVRMAGIKVGTVTDLSLNAKNYYANVSIMVSGDIQLPDDSSAKIASEGLLGGNYVSLSPGGSMDNLEAGGEIVYTQGSVDLIGLVSRALFSTGQGESEKK